MKITTNHHWREPLTVHDVPKQVLDEHFDWMKDEEKENSQYYCYKGFYYCDGDFIQARSAYWDGDFLQAKLTYWDGVKCEGFDWGILIKFNDDGQYKIATYSS